MNYCNKPAIKDYVLRYSKLPPPRRNILSTMAFSARNGAKRTVRPTLWTHPTTQLRKRRPDGGNPLTAEEKERIISAKAEAEKIKMEKPRKA